MQDISAEHHAERYQDCKTAVLKVLANTPDTATAGGQILQAIASTLGWPYMRLWHVDPVTDRLRPVATYTAPHAQPLPIPDSLARGEGQRRSGLRDVHREVQRPGHGRDLGVRELERGPRRERDPERGVVRPGGLLVARRLGQAADQRRQRPPEHRS